MSEWSLPSAELMRDLETSAYSFAYYADVAGRELTRAARFGRKLSLGVFLVHGDQLSPAAVSALIAESAPDLSVSARVDTGEFHLLMPELSGLSAQTVRRRIQEQLAIRLGIPASYQRTLNHVLMGTASFPHEGRDLASLVRLSRIRAEQSAFSPLVALSDIQGNPLEHALRCLEESTGENAPLRPITVQSSAIELPMVQAGILGVSALNEALRGGAVQLVISYQPEPSFFTTLRAVLGGLPRTGVAMRVLDIRKGPGCENLECLCLLAEHGAYSIVGRRETLKGSPPVFRGVHTTDPLVADCLSHWMSQTAGVPLLA